jgi:hypothetical protein
MALRVDVRVLAERLPPRVDQPIRQRVAGPYWLAEVLVLGRRLPLVEPHQPRHDHVCLATALRAGHNERVVRVVAQLGIVVHLLVALDAIDELTTLGPQKCLLISSLLCGLEGASVRILDKLCDAFEGLLVSGQVLLLVVRSELGLHEVEVLLDQVERRLLEGGLFSLLLLLLL